jgi:BsuBI/PstI restriction endonuclease domain/BsuBI/PstI restriction endonuclease HTH domain
VTSAKKLLREAQAVLLDLGFPAEQQNERTALTLLALLNLRPGANWAAAEQPMMGVTPIMDWARAHYRKNYAPNTRETIRRQSLHQMVDAGLVSYNPDDPSRAVNSPKAVYQVTPAALALVKIFATADWPGHLANYLIGQQTLIQRNAAPRALHLVSVSVAPGQTLQLSPGAHSQLIQAVVAEFAPRFAPGAALVYAGDTGSKWAFFDRELLLSLGGKLDDHGKMPDVVLFDKRRRWLLLVEAVTSHGPVSGKRRAELTRLFAGAVVGGKVSGLVFVTAFPNRQVMGKYLADMAWETEVWVADAPDHMIHFNGDRFLGPHEVK